MKSPQFLDIWTAEGWMEYFWNNRPAKSRQYYQLRSAVRMLLWIPLTTFTVYMLLAFVEVYS
jgi:hypothetical protein